jgi:hypothetical protein
MLWIYFYDLEDMPTFNAIQAKERSYYDWHPTYQFLLLTIEVFGCLQEQVDVFLHDCGNAICNFKEPKGPPLSILIICFSQKISIMLQSKHPPS